MKSNCILFMPRVSATPTKYNIWHKGYMMHVIKYKNFIVCIRGGNAINLTLQCKYVFWRY